MSQERLRISSLGPGEKNVLAEMGKEFDTLVRDQSKSIIRAVAEIANKNGYDLAYLQYLFFVLFERNQDWPRLSKDDFGALNVLTRTLAADGEIPRYRDGLQIPDHANESLVDPVLKKIALWAQTKLASQILKGYQGLLQKYSQGWLAVSDYTPPNKAMGVLKFVFEASLRKLPIYVNSTLMDNVVRFIL